MQKGNQELGMVRNHHESGQLFSHKLYVGFEAWKFGPKLEFRQRFYLFSTRRTIESCSLLLEYLRRLSLTDTWYWRPPYFLQGHILQFGQCFHFRAE